MPRGNGEVGPLDAVAMVEQRADEIAAQLAKLLAAARLGPSPGAAAGAPVTPLAAGPKPAPRARTPNGPPPVAGAMVRSRTPAQQRRGRSPAPPQPQQRGRSPAKRGSSPRRAASVGAPGGRNAAAEGRQRGEQAAVEFLTARRRASSPSPGGWARAERNLGLAMGLAVPVDGDGQRDRARRPTSRSSSRSRGEDRSRSQPRSRPSSRSSSPAVRRLGSNRPRSPAATRPPTTGPRVGFGSSSPQRLRPQSRDELVRLANAAWSTMEAPGTVQQPTPRTSRPSARAPARAARGSDGAGALSSQARPSRSPVGARPRTPRAKGGPDQAVLKALTAQRPEDLTELDLSDTHLTNADIVKVARHAAVFNAPNLRTLSLSGCRVGSAGVQKLIDGLVFARLTVLRLDNNGIGDAGACALALCLGSTSKLGALYLQQNRIGDQGGSALARALVANFSLRVLHLGQNVMGEDSGTVYASVLSHHNRTLQELDGLDDNFPGVRDMGTMQRLAQALQRNRRHQMASQMAVANTDQQQRERERQPRGQQSGGFESPGYNDGHQYAADEVNSHAHVPSSSTGTCDTGEHRGSTTIVNFSGLSATELALFKRIQAADDTTSGLDSVQAHSVDTPADYLDDDSDDEFEAQLVTVGPQADAEHEIGSAPQGRAADGSEGDIPSPKQTVLVTCSSNEADDADITAARDAVRQAAEAFAAMHGFSYGRKPSQGEPSYGNYDTDGAGWSTTRSAESTILENSRAGPANEEQPTTSSLSSFGLLESSLQELSTGFRPTPSTPAATATVAAPGSAAARDGVYHDEPSAMSSDDEHEMRLTGLGTEVDDGSAISISSSASVSRARSIEQALEQARQMLDIG